MKHTLILASSSPRRRELIQSLRLPVQIHPSEAGETIEPGLSPAEIVEILSLRKAQAVADQCGTGQNGSIVVGSDTIVVLHGKVLGKPQNRQDARSMLNLLQGRTHEVYSGVACIQLGTERSRTAHRSTSVTMKPLTLERIERYIETGEPMDKAGAYAIQGIGATLIEEIHGDYFTVVGLPLSLLSDMLGELGVNVL